MNERRTDAKSAKKLPTTSNKRAKGNKSQIARILECPEQLGPVARQEWDRVVGELTARGVLSSVDRAALAAYCHAYAKWLEAIDTIEKYGAVMKSPTGYPVQSPYVAIANRQAEIMLRLVGELGFTPASRSRIFTLSKATRCCWNQKRMREATSGNRNGSARSPIQVADSSSCSG
jgi:P27 family predicted phage terminase small subunit